MTTLRMSAGTTMIDPGAPTRALEVWLSAYTIALGLWWSFLGNYAHAYPSCIGMMEALPQSVWAGLLLITGVLHLGAVLFGSVNGRKGAAFWSALVRVGVAIVMLHATPADPACISHICTSGASLWAYWRIQPCGSSTMQYRS